MTRNVARLGDIATITSGFAFQSSHFNDLNEGLPLVRIRDVTVGSSETFYSGEFKDEFLVSDGDALIGMDGQFNLAKWRGGRALLNQRVCKVQALNGQVDQEYLLRFLPAALKKIEDRTPFVTVKHLSVKELREVEVPTPPIAEQRRIASILDKADALRAKRRDAIAKLDQLLQSVFRDMFGDPKTNPRDWPMHRLDEVTECLDRLRRPVTAKDREPGEVPYYGANGLQGWIDRALFNEPLVLVAEDGGHFDDPHRGVAYRIDGPAWVNNHAHILRAKQGILETEYLHRALEHYNFLPYISGTTRAKLTQGQLNGVPLLVPPIDLQSEFARRIERIRKVAAAHSGARNRSNELFQSLQKQAFEGAL